MSKRKYAQILDVLRNHPVTDPRGAMIAIGNIVDSKSLAPKAPKPSLTIKVFERGDEIEVVLKHVDGVDPGVVLSAKQAINDFGHNTYGDAIKDAETGELLGFTKFGDYKGVTKISGSNCNCDLPAGAVYQQEINGTTTTAFTNLDDLMAYAQSKANSDTN